MSILITSDWHLSDNPRDEYRWKVFDEIGGLIDRHEVMMLYILGDLTEQKDYHSARLTNRLVDSFMQLELPITVLRGNHDGQTIDNPFFKFLRELPHVQWIQEPVVEPSSYLFLPYSSDPVREWKTLLKT